eukprot:GHVP01022344.1.p1 GENE.GHVP01022344.1~~GHVP01022344.1.p1  ORF type:complete len:141 (-),score=14.55 GHVP01022344.1:313-699(-)
MHVDQGFFKLFFHNSPSKPALLDTEREVTVVIMDLTKKDYNRKTNNSESHPGDDLCNIAHFPGLNSKFKKNKGIWKKPPCNHMKEKSRSKQKNLSRIRYSTKFKLQFSFQLSRSASSSKSHLLYYNFY